jgi:uncharacterized repeat protein (TIGR03943 family)
VKRFEHRRLLRGLSIAVWAGFFDWLWLSGEAARYVGSRTSWVVPFGGIVLTITALLYLASSRSRDPGPAPTRREFAGVLVLLAPVLAIAVIPAPTLGALAVKKKQSGLAYLASADAAADREVPLSIDEIAYASASSEYAKARGADPGRKVSLVGFISSRERDGRLGLSRFDASCCAADAVPYTVMLRPPRGTSFSIDQWVSVEGRLKRERDGSLSIQVTKIHDTSEPTQAFF